MTDIRVSSTDAVNPKMAALYIAVKKRTKEAMRKGLEPDDALQVVANALGAMIGECTTSRKPEDAERIAKTYADIILSMARVAASGMHRIAKNEGSA